MKPWTERHAREGRALALVILSERALGGDELDELGETVEDAGLKSAWRPRSTLSYALRLDAAGMNAALRKIRGLAEGRHVRERGWRGTSRDGSTLAWTADAATARRWRKTGAKVVRVVRIRRSS